ncbi:MAG: hypothetical protein MO846_06500 [Candidatus Devosia symbiotica]|nr:hypothetical protein [Candidatus Devosia symbiotica]
MPLVAEYAKLFGVYDTMQPMLAMMPCADETADMRMMAAYAIIANSCGHDHGVNQSEFGS